MPAPQADPGHRPWGRRAREESLYGRRLFATRPLPTWRFLLGTLVGLGCAFVAGLFTVERSVHIALVVLGAAALTCVVFGASGYVEQSRVHERALLVGVALPRTRAYVIPLATIDPRSIAAHVRANRIAARLGGQGLPHLRMTFYSTRAVTLRGLSVESARALDGRPVPVDAGESTYPAYERCTWALGTHRSAALAGAIADALEVQGRRGARAAVDASLAAPYREPDDPRLVEASGAGR